MVKERYLKSLYTIEESKNLISQENNLLGSSVYHTTAMDGSNLQREPFKNKDLEQTMLKCATANKTELVPHQFDSFQINLKCLQCGYEFNQEGCGEISKASNPDPKLLQSIDLNSDSITSHKSTLPCPKCSTIVRCEDKKCLDSEMFGHFEDISLTNSNSSDTSPSSNTINKNYLKCSYCEYTTNIRGHFKLHQLRHSQVNLFKCSECSFKTDRENSLKQHLAQHFQPHHFKCQDCDFHTDLKLALVQHKQTHSKTGCFSCDSCTFITNNKGELKIHKLNKCEVKPAFKCTKCDFETKEKGHFSLHLLKHVKEVEVQHSELSEIKQTNRQPVVKTNLISKMSLGEYNPIVSVFDHSIIANNERLYICPSCSFETSGVRIFRKHMNTHPELNNHRYSCALCDYTCRYSTSYRVHVLNHSGKYLFHCECCDYKTNNKSNFKLHMKVHSKELSCCFCSYKTKERLLLKEHLLSHSNLSVQIFGKENIEG